MIMKQSKLNPEDLQWIKDHPKEFTQELVKNFYHLLEPYREKGQRKEYSKRFKELLKKEREKHGRTNH
jgi:ferritin-like protein